MGISQNSPALSLEARHLHFRLYDEQTQLRFGREAAAEAEAEVEAAKKEAQSRVAGIGFGDLDLESLGFRDQCM